MSKTKDLFINSLYVLGGAYAGLHIMTRHKIDTDIKYVGSLSTTSSNAGVIRDCRNNLVRLYNSPLYHRLFHYTKIDEIVQQAREASGLISEKITNTDQKD